MAANGGSTVWRNTPDVALTASGIYVRAGNASYTVVGTSCAAPLWAGFTALVNQEAVASGTSTVGFINPAVYALGSSSSYGAAFHDITSGNNTSTASPNAFYAGTGYDLCTGIGSPNGMALINALALGADNLGLSFASLLAAGLAGGPFSSGTCNLTLTNVGSSPVNWSASATQSWVSLSATGGTLAASGSAVVTASINANANALPLGTYYDTISITDLGTGYVQTRPVSLTVQTPFEAWQSEFFTPPELADTSISGPAATPAGDGISNLMKYALGLDPWTDGVSGLPVGSILTSGSGSYLTLTYTQVLSATDITYAPQVSTDLETWYSGPGYTTVISTTPNVGQGTENVTVQSVNPVGGEAGEFMRLQVTGTMGN